MEAHYHHAFFEFSMEAVLITAPSGSIIAANPAACGLFGLTEEEICNAGRAGLVDASSPQLKEILTERERTGRIRGELILIRGDGTRFPGEISSAAFADADGSIRTIITIRDLTALIAGIRKDAESAMRQEAMISAEEERQRTLGHELHDNLGQQIAAIGYQAKVLEKMLTSSGNTDAKKLISSISSQVQDAVIECKNIAHGLLPFEIEDNGLEAALQALASRVATTYWTAILNSEYSTYKSRKKMFV